MLEPPLPFAAAAWVLISACSAGGQQDSQNRSSGFTVRDSAGVRISESPDSTWTTETRWQVETEPYLEIGSRHGGEGTDFGQIGPVVQFADGRLGVADLQALDIRIFGPDGQFHGAWGRSGSGPGELQRVDGLGLIRGDSLIIRNDGIFRHEIYGPAGRFGRTVRAPSPGLIRGGGRAIAWMEDGSFVFGPTDVPLIIEGRERVLLHGYWHAFGPTGEYLGQLATLPERWAESAEGVRSPIPVVYGARAYVAGSSDGLWYGFPDNFEVHRISVEGIDRIIRRAWAPEPVTSAMRTGYADWYSQGARREVDPGLIYETTLMRRAEAQNAAAPGGNLSLVFADTLPAFVGLLVSTDDHLWVRLPANSAELERIPEHISTNNWSVFDPEGRWLGTVSTPPGLEVRLVAEEFVLGVWKDPLDVEYVRAHRMTRTGVPLDGR